MGLATRTLDESMAVNAPHDTESEETTEETKSLVSDLVKAVKNKKPIGHTSNGKPIHAEGKYHTGFDEEDHRDAAELHDDIAIKLGRAADKYDYGSSHGTANALPPAARTYLLNCAKHHRSMAEGHRQAQNKGKNESWKTEPDKSFETAKSLLAKAQLSYAERKKGSFVFHKDRRYPIHDLSCLKKALKHSLTHHSKKFGTQPMGRFPSRTAAVEHAESHIGMIGGKKTIKIKKALEFKQMGQGHFAHAGHGSYGIAPKGKGHILQYKPKGGAQKTFGPFPSKEHAAGAALMHHFSTGSLKNSLTEDQALAAMILDNGLLSDSMLIKSPTGENGFAATRIGVTVEKWKAALDAFLSKSVHEEKLAMVKEVKARCPMHSAPQNFVGGNLSTPMNALRCSCRAPTLQGLALRVMDRVNEAIPVNPIVASARQYGLLSAEAVVRRCV